jgi:CRISPR system Cascade subunit CasA
MNLLTFEKIESIRYWISGLGVPPWEIMPKSETCNEANNLKTSYFGCLVAMSRFVYLVDEGIYYLAGIQYPSHVEGWREPSISVNDSESKAKLLWVDPHKRPWRELTSLLSFISSNSQSGFDCQQIRFGLLRARQNDQDIGIWSGGLKVRANSGDQSIKQDDDFVESLVYLPKQELGGAWFANLQLEMTELEQLSKIVYSATFNYFESQNMKDKTRSGLASNLFWQLCERKFQDMVYACEDFNQANALRKNFAGFANQAYDRFCAKDTARQLDAWAKNRPNLGKYLKDQTKTEEAHA